MSTEAGQISVGGIRVDIVRKAIKNLHLGVYPPDGRVRVAAPLGVSDEAVRLAVVTRMSWIKRRRASFIEQPRQPARSYVSGETHYVLGQRYRLKLIESEGPARVGLRNNSTMELRVRAGSDIAGRERVVLGWYRRELRSRALPLVEEWAAALRVPVPATGIKRMKTKWGSCSIAAGRIWLNLELIKKPPQCLEYIIVHELAHLVEPSHSDRFVALMDRLLPNWRLVRDELNAQPLRDETWTN